MFNGRNKNNGQRQQQERFRWNFNVVLHNKPLWLGLSFIDKNKLFLFI